MNIPVPDDGGMQFEFSPKVKALQARLQRFMDDHVYPIEIERQTFVKDPANLWQEWPGLADLKERAKAEGLWNLFLPLEYGEYSPGLTTLEYAPLAEIMGRIHWASEIFNCSAPDTGNMEVLAKFGSAEQRAEWLDPLLEGRIRSVYAMTEPEVASSDATSIATTILPEGDDYVINGRKWWITNGLHPDLGVLLVMGKTFADGPRHEQHSVILVPADSPGWRVIRPIAAFGSLHSPFGEAEIEFENCRVPKANMILGPGRGFEIAQGRLGPGRIHHCMRSIGQAQRMLELMIDRATSRSTFGTRLADHGSVRQDIARSFCDIEQARLLTLKAAAQMDRYGNKVARDLIAAVKIVVPQMALTVADRAMQVHGAMGFSDDTPIADLYLNNRFLRMADGPDEVHMSQLGRIKISDRQKVSAGRKG